jgi:transcriptional regulator with PAS, ATPase and Fis domain
MQKILKLASKIAKTDSTVLITGESGVGKEVIAKYIYDQSEKKNNFVKINCAAIPETLLESELFGYEKGAFSGARKSGKPGLIEEADKGTLFLDEIGELSLNMQAKLLQVLQEHSVFRIGSVKPKEVDFRLIAATNRNLEKMVADKEFREDLYYRLNVLPICIPPIRKRKVDIPALAKKTLTDLSKKYDKEISISDQALEILIKYDWPGNVREINNIIERLILTIDSNIIRKKDVIALLENDFIDGGISVSSIMPLSEAVEEVEKKILEMAQQGGKSTYEIADMLKVNQSTVVRKINKYFN